MTDFANLAALPGFGSRVVAERPVIQFDAIAEYKRHDSHRSRLPADLTLSKGQTGLTQTAFSITAGQPGNSIRLV
jgi:hypothetical protein